MQVFGVKELNFDLTRDEYINHLKTLKLNNEIELLYRSLILNKAFLTPNENQNRLKTVRKKLFKYESPKRMTTFRHFSNISKEYNLFMDTESTEKITSSNILSYQEYLDELKPHIFFDSHLERRTLKIIQYSHNTTLNTGDIFGESSLTSTDITRYFI